MSQLLKGGYLCGAVRYEARCPPQFSIHCYCRQCQHITGAGHASQFSLAAADVAITGQLSTYEMKADSGNVVTTAFCPTCGSPILKKSSGYPQLLFFHAGSLDDSAPFRAQRNVWDSGRQPWDPVDASLVTS